MMDYKYKSAKFGECGLYRYTLTRVWESNLPSLCWVMLNPSTADALTDDPTIRRCVGFSKRWGYGSLVVVNLFAFRATDPKVMLAADDPVGPRNDGEIATMAMTRDTVVAWGSSPAKKVAERAETVLAVLKLYKVKVTCLGKTMGGHPVHPLYQRSDAQRIDYP